MPLPSRETTYEHIVLDETGAPMIAGTTIKVIELVLERMAYGWSPEELYFQHPYLTLGQIYSALAYYWDHREDLDKNIEQRRDLVRLLQSDAGESPLKKRLKAQGLI